MSNCCLAGLTRGICNKWRRLVIPANSQRLEKKFVVSFKDYKDNLQFEFRLFLGFITYHYSDYLAFMVLSSVNGFAVVTGVSQTLNETG